MKTPGDIEELKNAIRLAGEKQSIDWKLLKEQFLMTCETLKPGNFLRSTLRELTYGPNLTKLVVGTALGLATGYLSKKIVVGTSAIVLRKIMAGILQFSATRIFSRDVNVPYFFGKRIQQSLSQKNIQ